MRRPERQESTTPPAFCIILSPSAERYRLAATQGDKYRIVFKGERLKAGCVSLSRPTLLHRFNSSCKIRAQAKAWATKNIPDLDLSFFFFSLTLIFPRAGK
jgi:hypothetical protein